VLGQNEEAVPSGSDVGGRLIDLVEGARRRNLASNSLAAYEVLGRRFSHGRQLLVWIHGVFLYCPGGGPVFRGEEECGEPETDQSRALLW
jgi:hypothetical protein